MSFGAVEAADTLATSRDCVSRNRSIQNSGRRRATEVVGDLIESEVSLFFHSRATFAGCNHGYTSKSDVPHICSVLRAKWLRFLRHAKYV
eukprot:5746804-Amphidinium_carterae.2